MREYIRQHVKMILVITVIVVGSILVIGTNELVALMLPDATELQFISCDMEEDGVYEYTGKAVEPKIESVVLQDKEGNEIIKKSSDIFIMNYSNNVDIGNAGMEISLNGYRGSIVIENAFCIQLGQVNNLQIVNATKANIDLAWDKVSGAEGYLVFKSADNGETYTEMQNISDGNTTVWQDVEIGFNATYLYKICAYATLNDEIIYGNHSEHVMQQTPLATPVLSDVSNVAYNSLQVKWKVVEGAVGYQVYRSQTKDGEYECISEITDGSVTSYTDATCKCGINYYYYIKAAQKLDETIIYGDASDLLSAKSTPNRVSLSGTTTEDDTKVTLKWKKSAGAQGYQIYRSKGDTSNYSVIKTIKSADTLSWSQPGLDKETAYYYKVRPYCVVNGKTVTGSYSGAYEKEAIYVYSGPEITGEVSALTSYVGYSYVWGGTTPKGWDCSGFAQWVFNKHFGISLPRTSGEQARGGIAVSKSNRSAWKPGDLLFYKEGGRISHVAIYLGGGQMIHALNSKYDTLIQGVDYYERWDSKTTLTSVRRYF